MKKRAICFLLAVLCFAFPVGGVFAAGTGSEVELSDLNMKVRIPEGFGIITRDSGRQDEAVLWSGRDYDELMKSYKENNIYLNALTQDKGKEFIITMKPSGISKPPFSYNEATEEELNQYLTSALENTQYTNGSRYRTEQTVYLQLMYSTIAGSKKIYGIVCNTIINGQFISIAYYLHNHKITSDEVLLMDELMNSVVYSKVQEGVVGTDNTNTTFIWVSVGIGVVLLAAILIIYFLRKAKLKK